MPSTAMLGSIVTILLAGTIAGCASSDDVAFTADADIAILIDSGADDGGANVDADTSLSSLVQVTTFNWPARYGPMPGVDSEDEVLWSELSAQASVLALQEAGWIAGYLRSQDWEVHRPNPPGDDDDQPVGNFLTWNPQTWSIIDKGWHPLSPRTAIQEEAAGPTQHRAKYVVWARLRNLADDSEWVFGSVHFVPSKHLGGAALALWKQQRDSLLDWWALEGDSTIVMGDFNAQPEDSVAQPLWEVAQRQTVKSFGQREIDWIVRKPVLSAEGVEALDNRGQSDHKPVRGVVRWSR